MFAKSRIGHNSHKKDRCEDHFILRNYLSNGKITKEVEKVSFGILRVELNASVDHTKMKKLVNDGCNKVRCEYCKLSIITTLTSYRLRTPSPTINSQISR